VGCLARLLTPGRDAGTIVIVVLAMGGALVGGYVGYALGWYAGDEPTSLVMAGVGSVALLALYRLLVSPPSDF
jgi:uncharacterized membrane protein YeaQ/YmgE (transglycosylase-associated protein family)